MIFDGPDFHVPPSYEIGIRFLRENDVKQIDIHGMVSYL